MATTKDKDMQKDLKNTKTDAAQKAENRTDKAGAAKSEKDNDRLTKDNKKMGH